KANVPSRIAFAVSSQTDSRVILDTAGAEALLGSGDMLYKPLGTSRLQRVQGGYISEEEIALLVQQCRTQAEPEFSEELLEAAPRARHLRRGPAHGRSHSHRGVNGATWQARTAVALLIGALALVICGLLTIYVSGAFALATIAVAIALGWFLGPVYGTVGAG